MEVEFSPHQGPQESALSQWGIEIRSVTGLTHSHLPKGDEVKLQAQVQPYSVLAECRIDANRADLQEAVLSTALSQILVDVSTFEEARQLTAGDSIEQGLSTLAADLINQIIIQLFNHERDEATIGDYSVHIRWNDISWNDYPIENAVNDSGKRGHSSFTVFASVTMLEKRTPISNRGTF